MQCIYGTDPLSCSGRRVNLFYLQHLAWSLIIDQKGCLGLGLSYLSFWIKKMQILRQHACQVLIAIAVLGSASSADVITLQVTKRAILYKIECALRIHREEYFTVYLGIAEIIFDTPTTTTTPSFWQRALWGTFRYKPSWQTFWPFVRQEKHREKSLPQAVCESRHKGGQTKFKS